MRDATLPGAAQQAAVGSEANRPIRALLVTNQYPSAEHPSQGIYNRNRFCALARYCEVRVVVPVPGWRQKPPRSRDRTLPPEDCFSGLPARFPAYWSIPGLATAHEAGMWWSLRKGIRQLHAEFPFDVIVAAWAYPNAAAMARLASELNVPLVAMVLGSDVNELTERRSLRPRIARGLRGARRVVAVSSALRDRVAALGVDPDRIVVQRNGVDGERFSIRDRSEARQAVGLHTAGRIVCFVGRLGREKGCDVLVRAMRSLLDSPGSVEQLGETKLVVVGSGPESPELHELSRSLRLEDSVVFAGSRRPEEIPDWIAASDVVCLPSYREGCPNVVLEALACGRPVVASNVGGVPELIGARAGIGAANGATVPAGEPEALAEALRAALASEWDPAALRESVEFLSWDAYGRALWDCVRSAVDETR